MCPSPEGPLGFWCVCVPSQPGGPPEFECERHHRRWSGLEVTLRGVRSREWPCWRFCWSAVGDGRVGYRLCCVFRCDHQGRGAIGADGIGAMAGRRSGRGTEWYERGGLPGRPAAAGMGFQECPAPALPPCGGEAFKEQKSRAERCAGHQASAGSCRSFPQ